MWTSVCEGSRARTPAYRLLLMAAVIAVLLSPLMAAAVHAQSSCARPWPVA